MFNDPLILYIDPGTGSMLFTIIIGIVGVGIYFIRTLIMKLKFVFSGGKATKNSSILPIVIFSDHKRYWNIFEPVLDELEKRGQEAYFMTASPDDPALSKEYKHIKCQFIGEGNKAFSKLNLLQADIVFSTTPGLDVYQWKRSKSVKYYVHIPHAASDITMYRMFGIDFYDSILTSGQYQIDQLRELEKVRGIPQKEAVIVGIPYMDEMKKRLDAVKAGQAQKEKDNITVLLAPSWGKSSILVKYGRQFIEDLKATGYKIIIRPHPQSYTADKDVIEALMEEFKDIEWNRDNDNFEVLSRSDILISDFSGVMFDYSLVFDKPVIYTDTKFDNSPYDASWLEETPWTFRVLPKLGKKLDDENKDHLKELIDECITSDVYKEGRNSARAEAWNHMGEGAVRTADYLIAKLEELNKPEEPETPEEGDAGDGKSAKKKPAKKPSGKKSAKKEQDSVQSDNTGV